MTAAPRVVPASPYRGLAAFDDTELDALLFFGRERETEVIAANLLASRFTVLYGPSGVGKSSVLRAGVVRRLRALAPETAVVVFDSWAGDAAGELLRDVAVALGAEPPDGPLADGLEELVGRGVGELYLVLDQFEELFVYPGVDELVAAIADVVTRPGVRVHVLLSLRDDALSELDVFTGRIQNVFGNYLALERLERASARAAVVGPLERFNELSDGPPVEIEDALVEAVLDQVEAEAQPGSVEAPYLQLVLERLWAAEAAHGSRVLRRATLDELGGAAAVVRAHLGEAVDALTPPERDVAAHVLNHLVTPSGTKIAHAADDLAEYAGVGEDELRPVLASLGQSRILRPVDGRFEIYHDVLADPVVTWRLQHEGERELERQRAEAERRHRRLVALLVGSLVVLGVMVAVTVYALTQRADARRQADVARTEVLRAQASRLAAEAGVLLPVAQAELNPELALALAAEATRQSPTTRAVNALRRALLLSLLRAAPPEQRVTSASFSPDGRSFVVGTDDGTASIYSGDGASKEATLPVGSPVTAVAYGPDGGQVLTTERDGPATLWDAATGGEEQTFGTVPEAASLSPDGTLVLTVESGTASLWQAADGSLVHELRQPEAARAAAFAPGGDLVATVGPDGVTRVFDVETGARVAAVAHGGGVTDAEIAPDGARLVTAGEDGVARIWSLPQGRLLHELEGHSAPITSVAVSPDGTLVATTSADATARTWDLGPGDPVAELGGHLGRVDGAAFSDDSQSLATWGAGRTVRIGDPRSPAALAFLTGHADGVTSVSFDGRGDLALTTGADGRVRLWRSAVDADLEPVARVPRPLSAAQFSADGSAVALAGPAAVEVLDTAGGERIGSVPSPAAGAVAVGSDGELLAEAEPGQAAVIRVGAEEPVAVVETTGAATALALSLDDRLLAVGGEAGSIAVQALDGGNVADLDGPDAEVTALAFDSAAGRLAAGFADGTLAAWSLADGSRLYQLAEHERPRPVTSVAFSPDGGRLATAGGDAVARVRDAATGGVLYELRGHSGTVQSASFSPTGEWIVTSATASAALWDTSTRQRLLLLSGAGRLLTSSFDATGLAVLAVGSDGTLGRYACEVCAGVEELLALADGRIAATGRELTLQERGHYLDEG